MTDAKITAEDLAQIAKDIGNRKWHRAIYTMLEQEPELMACVTLRRDKIRRIAEAVGLTTREQDALDRQITLLLWIPLVALDRAHRRLWSDLMPTDVASSDSNADAGGAP